MFGRKKEKNKIVATQSGECIALEAVPDEVFADKLLGDGVAVIPTVDEVLSPVNGTVTQVFDTLHAYSVTSDDGLEILVHIGLNTVELKGKGFKPHVKQGDRVSAGDVLCVADIDFIKKSGYEIHTPIVITNADRVKNLELFRGMVTAGETVVMEYTGR